MLRSLQFAVFLAYFSGSFACAASRRQDLRSADAQSDTSGEEASGTDAGPDASDEAPPEADAPAWDLGVSDGAAPSGPGSCSGDLHSYTDEAGVPHKCAADEGCIGGACVRACDAAAASHGNVGCDFVIPTPLGLHGLAEPCFAVFLANNWAHDVKASLTIDGLTYDPTSFGRIPDGTANVASWPRIPSTGIPSGQVAVLFLSDDPSAKSALGGPETCPITPAIRQLGGAAVWDSAAGRGATGRGKAFHLTTDLPVSAYDIIPFGGARSYFPSAELVLPTSAWGTNYVTAMSRPANFGPSYWHGPAWGQIVASVDGTTVHLVPTTSLLGATDVAAAPKNVVTTYTLNAGEYIQWLPTDDMSGSIVDADKPVAYVGGLTDLCLSSSSSTGGGGCDASHQMTPPVSAMGSLYVAPPYATRKADLSEESIPYRLVGAVDGTTLTYDPPQPAAPTTLKAGQVVDFEALGAFTIASQNAEHPFFVGQHMSGCKVNGGSREGCVSDALPCCLGDEEFVNVLPPAQWLSSYVFFTDPTYSTTNLVIVREITPSGFAEVTVDCLGVVTGFAPVGTSKKYEIVNVDVVRGGASSSCKNGGHVASSAGRFGIMVWGLDHYASYAYPAGGNVARINAVTVPARPR